MVSAVGMKSQGEGSRFFQVVFKQDNGVFINLPSSGSSGKDTGIRRRLAISKPAIGSTQKEESLFLDRHRTKQPRRCAIRNTWHTAGTRDRTK